jgi:enamine deaminase RidA (YjgF/YER057c/UK114 family)
MPEKQFLNHSYIARPNGYSHVVTSPPGKMIFLSGAGGTDRTGKMPADFPSQAENTFQHLRNGLEMAGASFNDVVKINYFLKDINDLTELRKIRAKYLNMDKPPAATAVQTGLAEGMLLEVELVAIVPE